MGEGRLGQKMREVEVSADQFGDRWPLKLDKGTLRAYQINIGQFPPLLEITFRSDGGRVYALNGIAQREPQYSQIKPIWVVDPHMAPCHKSLDPLLRKAESLFFEEWLQRAAAIVPQAIVAMDPLAVPRAVMPSAYSAANRFMALWKVDRVQGYFLVKPAGTVPSKLVWATSPTYFLDQPVSAMAIAETWLPTPNPNINGLLNWVNFLRSLRASKQKPAEARQSRLNGWSLKI